MFVVNEDLRWDPVKKQKDILQYGLFSYEEVKNLLPYEIYVASNFQYFKISMAKGLVTMQQIRDFIKWYQKMMAEGKIMISG